MNKDKSTPIAIKRAMLKKQITQDFTSFFYKKPKWVVDLLNDVKYFDESLCDLIRIGEPKSQEEIVNLINSHLELEAKTFKTELKTYTVGEAKIIFGNGNKTN